jgi:hypothetical protein
MIEKIEALREKPRHVRNLYAFWIALSITLVIVGIWSMTLPARISNIEGKQAGEPEVADQSPALSEKLGSIFGRAKDAFSMIGIQASSTDTGSEGVPFREDLDFKALLASSSEQQAVQNASTSASSTASTTTATTQANATSSVSTTTAR